MAGWAGGGGWGVSGLRGRWKDDYRDASPARQSTMLTIRNFPGDR